MSKSIVCENREEWLVHRRKAVGASEVATVMGLSPWGSPLALWAEKRGLAPARDETSAMRLGRKLEGVVASEYQEETKRTLLARGEFTIFRHDSLPLACTLDREIPMPVTDAPGEGPGALEIKTSSARGADEAWAEEPPTYYQAQLQAQLLVMGWSWGSLAALLYGRDFRWCDLARHEGFQALLARKVEEFWHMVQTGKEPPADSREATTEALKLLYPTESAIVATLGADFEDLDAARERASGEIKKLEEIKDDASNRIKQAIGLASEGWLPSGVRYTFRTQERAEHTVPASSGRVLRRVKAPKK